MGLIECVSLIEDRTFSPALEEQVLSGLDRAFLSGLGRPQFARFEVQFIDVGLALATALDGQEAIQFEGFEVAADVALVQAKVFRKADLARKAVVILPCVAEQHGERHFVAGAELFRFQKKVRDLGEAASGRGIRALEDDVALLEDVGDVAVGLEIHTHIIARRRAASRVIPYPAGPADAADLRAGWRPERQATARASAASR